MQPFFSIIIPVYNSSKYIDRCLNSLINQEYKNFEVIAVDDGSTDNSLEILNTYSERDIRLKVIHQKNGGQTRARKAGISYAKGNYIVCVDSDDYVTRDYLNNIYNIIQKNQVDMVCCGMTVESSNGHTEYFLPLENGYYDKKKIVENVYPILIQPDKKEGFSPSLCAKAIKKDIISSCIKLVPDNMRLAEDMACSLPCVYHSNSVFISNTSGYIYCDNADSYTKGKKIFDVNGPEDLYFALSNGINILEYDFNAQLARRITREVFIVVSSMFNEKSKYKIIKGKVLNVLSIDLYKDEINKCHFSFAMNHTALRYYFFSIALKHRWIFLIYLYNKFFG